MGFSTLRVIVLIFSLFLLSGCATTKGGFLNPNFKDEDISKVGVILFPGPLGESATVTNIFTIELFTH